MAMGFLIKGGNPRKKTKWSPTGNAVYLTTGSCQNESSTESVLCLIMSEFVDLYKKFIPLMNLNDRYFESFQ